jgi:putative cardiolipin synthase
MAGAFIVCQRTENVTTRCHNCRSDVGAWCACVALFLRAEPDQRMRQMNNDNMIGFGRRLFLALIVAFALGGCAVMMPGADYPRTESVALENPEVTKIGKAVEPLAKARAPLSGFRLLPVGPDGFITRMQMADAAEKTLDVQYFVIQMDATGKLLSGQLLKAAERGVRVRILIDDSMSQGNNGREAQIVALALQPGIEIRVFNPFWYRGSFYPLRMFEFAVSSRRLDYRMHNKLFVADNEIALVGGRNIGDEYFQVGGEFEFGDYDVFAAGPIVRKLSAAFDTYWNSSIAIPIEAIHKGRPPEKVLGEFKQSVEAHRRELAHQDYLQRAASGEPLASMVGGKLPLTWANATVVVDSPDKAKVVKGEILGRLMHRSEAAAMNESKSEVVMVSPYLIPGPEGIDLIRDMRRKNVRVRILTNSLESNDVLGAHAAYINNRDDLLDSGEELFEVKPILEKPGGSGGVIQSGNSGRFALHAKAFVFDRQRLFVGSMNFDQRSLHLNTELGLIIDSPELSRQVAARFESIIQPANSYQVLFRPDATSPNRRMVWRTENDKKLVEYDEEPASCSLQRIHSKLLALLPLEQEY